MHGIALVFAAALGACGPTVDERTTATVSHGGGPSGAGPEGGENDARPDVDALAALGYADFGEPVTTDEPSDVSLHDPQRSAAGYNLYTSIPNSTAVLIDMEGNEIRRWESEDDDRTGWSRAELFSNGDLLCIRTRPGIDELIRFSWEGEVRWRREMYVHHDVEELPDGRILTLTRGPRAIPRVHATRDTIDHDLVYLSAEGETLVELSIYEALAAAPEVYTLEAPEVSEGEGKGPIDLLHCNTVHWIEAPLAGTPFRRGQVLVTFRHLDLIGVLDVDQARLVWAWGPGELQAPHEASIGSDGTILVLDNGWESRGYSRVLKLDPESKSIVWEYTAPEPRDFFTSGRGTVQELSNGNILVGNSSRGEAFEVTLQGKMVWRFRNPFKNEGNRARAVLRIERYEGLQIPGRAPYGEAQR